MDRLRSVPESPLDILLLPVNVHRRLNRRMTGLVFAFLFVGCFDLAFSFDPEMSQILSGSPGTLLLKAPLILISAFLLGALDVFCVIWPIADFARILAKRREKYISSGIPIILMKAYALSHVMFILPYVWLTYFGPDLSIPPMSWAVGTRLMFSIAVVLVQLLPFLQLGLIYRTLTVRSKLESFAKLFVVLALYFWSQLAASAVSYVAQWIHVILSGIG